MFDRMLWQDNVRDPARTYKATQNADGTVTMEPAGKLMQQGTNQSAENFNRMEEAIQDSQIAQQIIFQHQLQFEDDHEERVSGLETENIVETSLFYTPANSKRVTVLSRVYPDRLKYIPLGWILHTADSVCLASVSNP